MYSKNLSDLIRWYARTSPITEGKKQIIKATNRFIIPKHPSQKSRMKHGFDLDLNLSNPEHLRMWLYGDHDERYETNHLKSLIKPNSICWDIGANIGFYTCFFAKNISTDGHVYAFEPAKETYNYLCRQIENNNFHGKVTAYQLGIGAQQNDVNLYYDNANSAEGTASIIKGGAKQCHETIKINSIDNLLKGGTIQPADLIKIDVEGYQTDVLIGGEDFFRKSAPIVLIELKEDNKESMRKAEEIIRGYGFEIFEINKRSLTLCSDITKSKKRNFLLKKK
jgi:FkbM family methyltransferase